MDDKKKRNAIIGCFVFIVTWPLIFLSVLWKAQVLLMMWRWFIVEKFGLPAIGIPVAFGIILIIRMLFHDADEVANKDDSMLERLWTAVVIMYVPPTIILGVGWLVHGCM